MTKTYSELDASGRTPTTTTDVPRRPTPVRLTELTAGARGQLHTADLELGDRQMLYALGFGERCAFRLLKTGNPWIVQIRTTRIGLSETIARSLLVIPESEAGK